jgi:hypothetical protein
MRTLAILSIALVALGLGACTRQETDSAAREAGRNTEKLKVDAESAGKKVGKAAHELAIESEIAAKKAARELDGMAKGAREGWTEAKHEDREKSTK